jgi:hypothetical protein
LDQRPLIVIGGGIEPVPLSEVEVLLVGRLQPGIGDLARQLHELLDDLILVSHGEKPIVANAGNARHAVLEEALA